ncbi:MAG: hypothetical protein K0S33_3088 [Bacteroidetes bacterium]|jgi:hypothetical protein|nr:hypothetical protein [Bacteroidota bacterium]
MKTILFVLALLYTGLILGQENDTWPFYVYKTEADFFAGKRTVLCMHTGSSTSSGHVFKFKDEKKKRFKVSLPDSAFFGYDNAGLKKMRIPSIDKIFKMSYYSFLGGNKDYFIISKGQEGSYSFDEEGYVTAWIPFMYNGWAISFTYFDKKRNLENVTIEEILAFDPELKAKYDTETAGTDKKAFKAAKHLIDVKYFKEYMKRQMKTQ